MTTILSPRPVVAAAIVDSLSEPTKLLCAARSYPPALRGHFEFPGGKVEPGEAWQEALHREISEELSLTIRLGTELTPPGTETAWPIPKGRVMRVWFAQPAEPRPIPEAGPAHQLVSWISLDDVISLPWLASNSAIVQALLDEVRSR